MHVDLMRPAPGWHRCCLCFHAFRHADLWADEEGQLWDVCVPCQAMQRPTLTTWPIHDHPPSYALKFYRPLDYGETP